MPSLLQTEDACGPCLGALCTFRSVVRSPGGRRLFQQPWQPWTQSAPSEPTSTKIRGKTVLGNPRNFWHWTKDGGFDLTHPSTPDSDPIKPSIKLQCALTPVLVDPAKTALLVLDFQNYNVSRALGNDTKAYFAAEETPIDPRDSRGPSCGLPDYLANNWVL